MVETVKPGLLILYDFFYPAYKAGGPIQSLTNLVLSLEDSFTISIITSDHDLNDTRSLAGVKINTWSKLRLPGSQWEVAIFYAGAGKPNPGIIKNAINIFKPAVVYLNGIFSYRFVMIPLLTIKDIKIVICPRGMLQKGALAGKSLKKKIYLSLLNFSGLAKGVHWHATNKEEEMDIKTVFGAHSKIIVAGNIPRKPLEFITHTDKQAGELRLVYLSLISEKKNLLQLISIVTRVGESVTLDIYGPVKDISYWEKCKQAIKEGRGRIIYKGDVMPEDVQKLFSQYHASIILTKGENFGHAIYESLSSARPVITSHFTPWQQLEEKKAGWNVDILSEADIVDQINKAILLQQSAYNEYCEGAYKLAKEYFSSGFDLDAYKKLFYS